MAAPLHKENGQLIYPGWEQHPGQHREKELKYHLETQAAEVENINKFGNVSSVGQISEY